MSPKSLAVSIALGLCAIAPATAQQLPLETDLSDEVDFLLWCGSAFHFLGIVSEDDADAANFFAAGEVMTDKAALLLIASEVPEDSVMGLVERYDEQVIADFESDAPLPYDADSCIAALEF